MRYKRSNVAGANYFFTLVLQNRRPLFKKKKIVDLFLDAIEHVRDRHPFKIEAQVILPDHLHSLWLLPDGDANFATRWRLIKSRFTRAYLQQHPPFEICESKRNKNEQGVWQRRFWEHLIRDEEDFITHLDYIHYNPVRHGYVSAPADWRHSTFDDWVRQGVYDPHWGSDRPPVLPEWAGSE